MCSLFSGLFSRIKRIPEEIIKKKGARKLKILRLEGRTRARNKRERGRGGVRGETASQELRNQDLLEQMQI